MRFFTLNNRRFASPEPQVAAEIPLVSSGAQAAVHYDTMQKAALAHERRAIDNNRTQFINKIVDRRK
jgi:hypothetical protein